ncbi:5-formyltetrahydrofolate cyclo-ligase [Microbulbifer thermotolerans]|uniref:5-formyltetrahydrofolate cyclo-ligase n=1 Tax=Microbulbifer thermotolerans TaxID=252514 RepID=A0A143HPZ1_MICTH|nr:5-formyltetrahydrofolate cyclo-ligase [Microbulbifer thermotolerans]AMX03566.1 5-formyltetrahydrofolate cyclo-ligase [Microbulbifer thermotolerans]MCX2795266.1 5-formyltetrahydrofolate cyclo-ligase [Microbulbifer thermotolerans]MCX2801172.1 5-formyltetrahydrofolate cyclo-ligase [Microbulbifer thermotolerans]
MSENQARSEKAELRRHMRSARRSLSPYQQRLHGRAAVNRLIRSPLLQCARHIGIYWPMDGELDIRWLQERFPHKYFYLPVLPAEPHPHLRFRRWHGGPLSFRNRYRIPEPLRGHSLSPRRLDLVLVPLVAFSPSGARLGMGAGFYDRTFAFKHLLRGAGPVLVGAAHQLQCIPDLPTDSWDIPLDAVVTEKRIYRCR